MRNPSRSTWSAALVLMVMSCGRTPPDLEHHCSAAFEHRVRLELGDITEPSDRVQHERALRALRPAVVARCLGRNSEAETHCIRAAKRLADARECDAAATVSLGPGVAR